jgi:hypothetical protein
MCDHMREQGTELANVLGQTVHAYSLSPICFRIWTAKGTESA